MKRHYSDTQVRRFGVCRSNICDPKKRDDLVINRNRIKDLGDWIDHATTAASVSLLLLCGPPGCGKTTCVRVLAEERNIELLDWTTPIDSYECSDNNEYLKSVSVAHKFKSFLLGVGRYAPVVSNNSMSFMTKRLILVKDFPTCFLSSPDQFTEIIDMYVGHGHTPVIFICTESVKKKSKDIAYELFSEEFKQRHRILQMSFLPVPVTSVVKALKRVVQILRVSVSDELMRDIATESRGDVRKAINDLNILSVNSSQPKKSTSSVNKKLRNQDKTKNSSSKDSDRETTGLFHSVGRVLYAKRDVPNDVVKKGNNTFIDPRGNLVHKPLEIAKEFCHYANQFVSLAHSNYLDIFSSIECIAKAAEYLSDSDIIMSEWREKELLSTVGFSVAVCGFMESNIDPIRRWKPLRGSQWNDDLRIAVENRISVENLLSDYCVPKNDIILEVVPTMKLMWCSRNRDSKLIKWCPKGFFPHRSEELLTAVRTIKSDILISPPCLLEKSRIDSDSEIHISDDSD
ncbi:hypothetical protein R5R35_006353 [Gryllus longicercus]|uniref:Cell cycle checkpoint protein RAD17 n=1 Tax=Gryllus longicercus TaxID=2509291 RepID=A0AAN9VZY5_9ORTH